MPAYVFGGTYGARFQSVGSTSYAWEDVGDQATVHLRMKFKIVSIGANSLTVARFRTATGGGVVMLYRNGSGKLTMRNEVTGTTLTSTLTLNVGQWYDLQLRGALGTGGGTTVWVDGTQVPELSVTQSLGTTPMRRIQVGESSSGRTYDLAVDDVVVAASFIGP